MVLEEKVGNGRYHFSEIEGGHGMFFCHWGGDEICYHLFRFYTKMNGSLSLGIGSCFLCEPGILNASACSW